MRTSLFWQTIESTSSLANLPKENMSYSVETLYSEKNKNKKRIEYFYHFHYLYEKKRPAFANLTKGWKRMPR